MLVRCLAMMRGGGETRHLAWARELRALGVDVDIIAGGPLAFGRVRHPIDGVPATLIRSPYARDFVYRFQHRRGFGRLTMQALHADEEVFCRAAWRRIRARRDRPDVVHAHALHQAARLGAGRIPVVINLPGDPHPRYDNDLRLADALVSDGWGATHLPSRLGRAVDRVPKGVDAELFRPDGSDVRAALGLAGKAVVLTVARLVPIKNVALLVDAFAIVRGDVPNAHLVIVGEGTEGEALRQQCRTRGIADAVTFAGYVEQSGTARFYRVADVFALPSDFDNSPNVVLEAMASGLPVVSTDVGGVSEFVTEPSGGALVKRRDVQALAAALTRYLAAPADAKAAGRYNRARALAEFSWRASAQALLRVYQRVVEERAAA